MQTRLREPASAVTAEEVAAQRARDRDAEAATRARRPGRDASASRPSRPSSALPDEERAGAAAARRAPARRREQLGPVNPLAQDEYAEALAHVEELESQRERPRDRAARARATLDPRHRPRRSARPSRRRSPPRPRTSRRSPSSSSPAVAARCGSCARTPARARCSAAPRPTRRGRGRRRRARRAEAEGSEDLLGVEIEITPAGKSTKRLSLLSGGEKSMTALAFLFAVFLARPCPFYILDEVEAALDDLNISRFLELLRRLRRPRPVHRRHPPEAHDGGGRHALRRLDGRRRRLEGHLPARCRRPPPPPEPAGAASLQRRDGTRLERPLHHARRHDGAGGRGRPDEPEPERRRGFFRRLRENMRKTREALTAEIQATLFAASSTRRRGSASRRR